jgi:hypothetical protein
MKRFLFLILGLMGVCTVALPGSAATISYAEAARALTAACGADINALCKGVKPGGNRLQSCLSENAGSVSEQCKQTYSAVFESLAARAKAQASVPRLCKSDAERVCEDFRAGGARILRCLIRKDNVRKVTKKCNQAITEAGWR